MSHEKRERNPALARWIRRGTPSFALLLPMILVNLVALGFEDYIPYVKNITRWIALISLVLTLYVSGVSRRRSIIVGVLTLIAGLAWAPSLSYPRGLDIVVVGSFNVLTALAPIAILLKLRKEFDEEGVGSEVVMGALCAYLNIGTWFAFANRSVAALTRTPFFAQPEADNALNHMYFSFITLTSTGYGDLTPAYGPGRMFAAVEAIIGQLYLVTVVALVVSAYRRRR